MPAYLIADNTIIDPDGWAEYLQKVSPFLEKHGGVSLAGGSDLEVLEGDWKPTRLAVIRFPDKQSAKALLDDPEYQPLKELRRRTAKSNIVIVEGLP